MSHPIPSGIQPPAPQRWSADSEALGEHLHHCGAMRSHWHTLREGAQTLRSAMSSHVVTTGLVVIAPAIAIWLWR